jgi:hypothetical protein
MKATGHPQYLRAGMLTKQPNYHVNSPFSDVTCSNSNTQQIFHHNIIKINRLIFEHKHLLRVLQYR